MSAVIPPRPALLPVNVDGIPASMMATARWAPWRAVWDGKKQKYEKIPHRADRPAAGLSNKSTKGWATFHEALAAYHQDPGLFAGVGYLMTGPHGLIAVDLDHCVSAGVVEPWAAEVIAKLDSYTELSPSGNGLRVMIEGELERDWMNHDRGIEVYAGQAARFVTITGAKLPGSRQDIRRPPAAVMDAIAARWRKASTGAEVEDLHLPPLLGATDLPDLDEVDLPSHARNFLAAGADPGRDRSQALFATSIALSQAGLSPQVILSILESNEFAMEVALDHRRQDYDKALRYLWKDHCNRGTARAKEFQQLALADFEDAGPPAGDVEPAGLATLDDFDDLGAAQDDCADLLGDGPVVSRDLAPVKAERFSFVGLGEFLQRKPMDWIIKGILPRAALAVLYGESGAGKTFMALDQAMAIARGIEWRGLRVAQGAVAYVAAEGAGGFRDRVDAYCRNAGIDPATLPMHVLADAPNLMAKPDVIALGKQLKKLGPLAVIYMDTYARVMGDGNENEAKDTNQVIAQCALLHRLTGAIVVLIHHSGKDATKGARGSGALRAAADVEMAVTRTTKYRAMTISKMKDGEDGKDLRFRLNTVVIGVDEDGDERTSCVVEHMAAEADAGNDTAQHPKPNSVVQERILTQLGTYIGGEVDKEELIQDVREITPLPSTGVESPNWKALITRPLSKLVAQGLVIEQDGKLSLPKYTCN